MTRSRVETCERCTKRNRLVPTMIGTSERDCYEVDDDEVTRTHDSARIRSKRGKRLTKSRVETREECTE